MTSEISARIVSRWSIEGRRRITLRRKMAEEMKANMVDLERQSPSVILGILVLTLERIG
jgi:3-dehydroquinate dehydratase